MCMCVYMSVCACGSYRSTLSSSSVTPTLFLETGLELSLELTNLAYLSSWDPLVCLPSVGIIDIVCCAQLLIWVLGVWTWFYAKAVITLWTEPCPWHLTSVLSSDLMIFILLLLKWLIMLTPFPCACWLFIWVSLKRFWIILMLCTRACTCFPPTLCMEARQFFRSRCSPSAWVPAIGFRLSCFAANASHWVSSPAQ